MTATLQIATLYLTDGTRAVYSGAVQIGENARVERVEITDIPFPEGYTLEPIPTGEKRRYVVESGSIRQELSGWTANVDARSSTEAATKALAMCSPDWFPERLLVYPMEDRKSLTVFAVRDGKPIFSPQ